MDECNANYFVKIAGEGWIRNIPPRLLLSLSLSMLKLMLLQIERNDGNTIAILIYTFSFLFTSFSMNGKESKLKKLEGINNNLRILRINPLT